MKNNVHLKSSDIGMIRGYALATRSVSDFLVINEMLKRIEHAPNKRARLIAIAKANDTVQQLNREMQAVLAEMKEQIQSVWGDSCGE